MYYNDRRRGTVSIVCAAAWLTCGCAINSFYVVLAFMDLPSSNPGDSHGSTIEERRLGVLIEASSSLLSSPRLSDVIPSILTTARQLLIADAYALWRLNASQQTWDVVAAYGLSEEYQQAVVMEMSNSQALLEKPVVAEDVQSATVLSHRVESYRKEGIHAILVLPLKIHRHPLGTLVFYYKSPHKIPEADIQIATALANIAAAAIGTAEMYDEQTRLRLEAEENQRRLTFLSEASAILASSLEYEATLKAVANLAVPHIADFCGVSIVMEDGTLKPLAVAHSDPARVELALDMQRKYPTDPNAPRGAYNVVRTGISEIYPEITDEMLVQGARDAEHLRIVRALEIRSVMIVPMRARNTTLGLITFVGAESGRYFNQAYLTLAESLAQRAALAIDNARLYEQARSELAERERAFQERESHLAEIEELNARLRRSMTETHHRVKNSLQLISAIIDMHIQEADDTVPVESLHQLNMHVRILATVHDVLTKAAKEDREARALSVPNVLDQMIGLIRWTAVGRSIVDEIADAPMPIRQVTSLALITNELISNALKHTGGDVRVVFSIEDDRKSARLDVIDNGPGFPQDFSPAYANSTGLELVSSLVQLDLNGQVEYLNRSEGGANIAVTFPLKIVDISPES